MHPSKSEGIITAWHNTAKNESNNFSNYILEKSLPNIPNNKIAHYNII